MPLINTSINTDIESLLDETGVVPRQGTLQRLREPLQHDGSLKGQLEAAYLDRPRILEELNSIISSSESAHTKLRAIEMVLKMDGALKDTASASIPPFTIIINDPGSITMDGNPILFPREAA